MTTPLRLTQLSKGSGCGCKIAPAVLENILGTASGSAFKDLLVGNDTRDDAAVWRWNDGSSLIATVDFFTPIVDDPYEFGRIAAANAISDVYAMGGAPLLALAILGFPVDKLPVDTAARIMEGAKAICSQAGIPIAGGHSIDAAEPFFGLAVNGRVEEGQLRRNDTAQPGDLLYLTKPLGVGIMAAAAKRGLLTEAEFRPAIDIMATLNKVGTALASHSGVHAMTDITGFGFLGHLMEMAEGSGLSARVNTSSLPMIPAALPFMDQFVFPDNTYRNWNAYEKKTIGVSGPEFISLCDPQTSGGLLIAVSPSAVQDVESKLAKAQLTVPIRPVGSLLPKRADGKVVEVFSGEGF